MSKIVARNAQIFALGHDFSGRTNSVSLSFTSEAPEVTSFGSDVRERLSNGLKDSEMTGGGYYDSSASNTDELFSYLMTASTIYGFYPQSASAEYSGYEISGITTEYSSDFSVADAAMITWTVSGSGAVNRGLSLGYLTASGDTTGSGYLCTGCSIDFDADTALGISTLRLLEIAGTDAIFAASYQHSGDDSTFATLIDYGTFTTPNNLNSQQITAASQFRRLKYAMTATGSYQFTAMGFSGSRIG